MLLSRVCLSIGSILMTLGMISSVSLYDDIDIYTQGTPWENSKVKLSKSRENAYQCRSYLGARLFGSLKSVNPCSIEIWVKVCVFPED